MKTGFSPLAWLFILLVSALADYAALRVWRARSERSEHHERKLQRIRIRFLQKIGAQRLRSNPAAALGALSAGLGLMLWMALVDKDGALPQAGRMALATLGWLAAVAALPREERRRIPPVKGSTLKRRSCFLLAAGGALSILAAATTTNTPQLPHPVLTLGAWAGGVALVAAAVWPSANGRADEGRRPSAALWTAALLAAAAFLIRAYRLETAPSMLTGDEGTFGFDALGFLNGLHNNPFAASTFGYPPVFGMTLMPFIAALGRTTVGIRMLPALVGGLTAGAVYLAGRTMFGKRTAFWAALFLAGFDFHIRFSRLALSNLVDGLTFTLALTALWQAERDRRPAAFALAGLTAGLGLYFYATSRLLVIVIPLWLGVRYVQARGQRPFPWRGSAVTALAALSVALPLVWMMGLNPEAYNKSIRRASIFGPWMAQEQHLTGQSAAEITVRQVAAALAGFTRRPPADFYTSGKPLLSPPASLLFLTALGLMLRFRRDERLSLLGLWLAAIALAGSLSTTPPAVQRYVAVAPVLALLVGYALEQIRRGVLRAWPRGGIALTGLSCVLVLGMAVSGVRFYFGEYAPRDYLGGDHTWLAQRTADHFLAQGEKGSIVFIGDENMKFHSIPALPFLVGAKRGVTWLHPWGEARNHPPPEGPVLFVVVPERRAELSRLQSACPQGMLQSVLSPDGRNLGWFYDCPHYRWPSAASPAPALLR